MQNQIVFFKDWNMPNLDTTVDELLLIPSDQVLWKRDSAIARPNPCPHYIQNMLKIKDMNG